MVRDVCNMTTLEALQGRDAQVSKSIVEYTNALYKTEERGIKCVSVLIQDVKLSPEVLQTQRSKYEAKR